MDWLLGDEVAELRAVASEGTDSVKPSWQTIFRYELEVREEAMRRINMCGLNVKEALWQARNSDDLRTSFLVTPLALGDDDRSAENWNHQPEKQLKPQGQNAQAKNGNEEESSGNGNARTTGRR